MTILHKPVITEKSLKDATHGIFTFKADMTSTKKDIKEEVEKLFSVHVKRITTTIRKGKQKRAGKKRNEVQRPDVKIARLHLSKGEKIDLFEIGKTT